MSSQVGLASPFKRGRAPDNAPRFLTIERGDTIRVGDEDYRVMKVIRDGRFMIKPIRKQREEAEA